jgi:aquaporin Z
MVVRKYLAEFIGTFLLVFLAVGAAVSGISAVVGVDQGPGIGVVGVALAFGFVLVFLVSAIGPISGANVNPAVTIGLLLARKITLTDAIGYWIAQILGAVLGAAVLKYLTTGGGVTDQTGALGSNGYGTTINMGGAFVLETLLTLAFVLVILWVTDKVAQPVAAGLAIGVSLTTVHLVGIPLTGTSVNPARSLGPALFAGGEALSQLWLFIVAPLLGGVLAALVFAVARHPGDEPAEAV